MEIKEDKTLKKVIKIKDHIVDLLIVNETTQGTVAATQVTATILTITLTIKSITLR